MHALVGVWSAGAGAESDRKEGLEKNIVPVVSGLPGFIQGYWTAAADTGKLHSFIVFEDEAGVNRLKDYVESNGAAQAAAQISLESLTVVEVKASATR